MDYKKKYEESLERAKKLKETCDSTAVVGWMEYIFPELKESEDDRIRKSISNYINVTLDDNESVEKEKWLGWLEKQGEMKSKKEVDNLHNYLYGEQKPADMVEPKFKAGQWIIDTQDGGILHINKVLEYAYEVTTLNSGSYRLSRCSIETLYKPWTIQDAKNGDVLVGSKRGVILMFRGIGNTEWDDVIDYHCYYDCYREDFIVQKDLNYWGNTENNQLEPAIKEQCDLLFQKMKEAGYEWDTEKKKLSKCVIDEGKSEIDYCFTKMMNGEKVNPAWSEEDEERIREIIEYLNELYDKYRFDLNELNDKENWLKSLKDRIKGE